MEVIKNKFESEKKRIVDFCLKLYNDKLIVGTWGNVSIRVNDCGRDLFIVTPSGMEYEDTKTSDIDIVDSEGKLIDGFRKPSSELKMHLEIYRQRKDVNAVIHTHSTFASACAVAGTEIPMIIEDMIQHIGGGIKVAKYALPGTEELAENAAKALGSRNGVLLKNHGTVGVGPDINYAYKSCILIEKSAKIMILSKILGHMDVLNRDDAENMINNYNNFYGQR
jgi:L-ribulose-5-phosphate 4-epimerase